ncbi:MLP-like protein 43 [Bidens hawaiensis]|uniref:MLP-like protein 43 n=1 Tax=Bidens hawaiensis TaxID=980011 RepID=UPI004048FB8E
MALTGTITGNVEISSGGKALHDLLRYTPNDLSSICPSKVHACNLLSGRIGAVRSTIVWHFTHDGKKYTATEEIEEIDEANHKIVFKVIGGELVEEIYKAFKITFHCEQKDGKQWGIFTMEFEKPDTSVPDPNSFMDYLCGIIKDMDDHASKI